MANTAFFARNGLNVNNVFIVNSTAAAVGSNAILSFADYKIGNTTVNSTVNSTGVFVIVTNGVNTAVAQLTADATGQYGTLELGGNVGGAIDFKSPYSDDYDQRIISNTTILAIVGNTQLSGGALITDQLTNTVTFANTFKIGTGTTNVVANTSLIKVADATSTTNVAAGVVTVGTSVVNTTALAAGANVIVGTADVKIGNSTVNTFANSVLVKVANSTMTTNVGPGGVAVGTSVVNTTVLAAGANVIVGTVDIQIGNSTVNTFANSVLLKVANSTMTTNVGPGGVVVGTSTVNTTVVAAGANVIVSTTNVFVGNSTVNATLTSANLVLANTTGSYGAALQGKQTIWIPASAMIARSTSGAATGTVEMSTNKNMFSTLDFDTTSAEYAQFEIAMPKSWNLGTVTFQPIWSHASTTTNFGVVWELAGVARGDDDAGDVAFGTAQSSTDTGGTTNDIYIAPESAAITIAGTPAVGDTVQFQINRAPANGSDTLAIDARLHGVKVYITTNAGNDV